MYEEYWGLNQKPFQNTPDPRFLYYSNQHQEALSRMLYAIKERVGAAMLTGIFGCGKTVLAEAIFDELKKEHYQVASITNPQLEYVDLLRAIVRNLKEIELPTKKTEISTDYLHEVLENILMANYREGKDTVIIVDEAHIIQDDQVFNELRLLLNFHQQNRFLLTLLLFGQPELRQKIEDNKPFEQRIAIKCYLNALNQEETKNYVLHRLKVSRRDAPIFTEEALKTIFDFSGGIPRRINRICDLGLLTGFIEKASVVDEIIIKDEIESFT
ncbi:MAG: AAA family ATPase [Candidatus Omnitrophota bacterium]